MTAPSRTITKEVLAQHFHLPLADVAKKLGTCTTLLKKICRQNGIPRWPYRRLCSLDKKINLLESSISEDTAATATATAAGQSDGGAQQAGGATPRANAAKDLSGLRVRRANLLENPELINKQVGGVPSEMLDSWSATPSYEAEAAFARAARAAELAAEAGVDAISGHTSDSRRALLVTRLQEHTSATVAGAGPAGSPQQQQQKTPASPSVTSPLPPLYPTSWTRDSGIPTFLHSSPPPQSPSVRTEAIQRSSLCVPSPQAPQEPKRSLCSAAPEPATEDVGPDQKDDDQEEQRSDS